MLLKDYLLSNSTVVTDLIETFYLLSGCDQLNNDSSKFIKSRIFETNISRKLPDLKFEDAKHNYFSYKEFDKVVKISLKTANKLFQHRIKRTTPIVLVNIQGKNKRINIDDIDFDYLLLISPLQKGIALCKKDHVKPSNYGSQIKCQIEHKHLEFIKLPDYKIKKSEHTVKINGIIKNLIDNFVNDVYDSAERLIKNNTNEIH